MADNESIEDQQPHSTNDGLRELEFIAAIRKGLSELDNSDSVPIEEVEKLLPSWIVKT